MKNPPLDRFEYFSLEISFEISLLEFKMRDFVKWRLMILFWLIGFVASEKPESGNHFNH